MTEQPPIHEQVVFSLPSAQEQRVVSPREALHRSESVEWYTPTEYIESVKRLMGAIDLDPASCQEANAVVGAKYFFSKEADGLGQFWFGRVFLNPPYGKTGKWSNQDRWSRRLMVEYEVGRVKEAVLLVNAATDTAWFRSLWAYPLCFVTGRIRFWRTAGSAARPTHGSVFVYLGPKTERFATIFSRFGVIARAMSP